MPQPNDLSRSLVALDQDSTIIAVVEMSQSSWLVAGVLPGVERQPRKKLEPSAERLLCLLHRWRDDGTRSRDPGVFKKVLETICAIANIGPHSTGAVFVGIADDQADADRIAVIDGIVPYQVGSRWIVGIDREATILRMTVERYYQLWRDNIDKSGLSPHLKTDVL